jgi:hypothetical protein
MDTAVMDTHRSTQDDKSTYGFRIRKRFSLIDPDHVELVPGVGQCFSDQTGALVVDVLDDRPRSTPLDSSDH